MLEPASLLLPDISPWTRRHRPRMEFRRVPDAVPVGGNRYVCWGDGLSECQLFDLQDKL